MQKDRSRNRQYMEIISELKPGIYRDNYFHSIIDLNLIKLGLILRSGILSKRNIERQNISSVYTHEAYDFDSKNGYDYVSITKYNGEERQNIIFDSFAMHTLSSISIAIDGSISVTHAGERETYFDDEYFVRDGIGTEHFTGILVPDHLIGSKISEIVCTSNDIGSFTNKNIDKWIRIVEEYFKTKIDRQRISDSCRILWEIFGDYESPERWVGDALLEQSDRFGEDLRDVLSMILQSCWDERIGKQNVEVLDVVSYVNRNDLPIYDIKGRQLVKK